MVRIKHDRRLGSEDEKSYWNSGRVARESFIQLINSRSTSWRLQILITTELHRIVLSALVGLSLQRPDLKFIDHSLEQNRILALFIVSLVLIDFLFTPSSRFPTGLFPGIDNVMDFLGNLVKPDYLFWKHTIKYTVFQRMLNMLKYSYQIFLINLWYNTCDSSLMHSIIKLETSMIIILILKW